jgi:hypothetical protein
MSPRDRIDLLSLLLKRNSKMEIGFPEDRPFALTIPAMPRIVGKRQIEDFALLR